MPTFPFGKAAFSMLVLSLVSGLWLAAHPSPPKTSTLSFWTFAKTHYDAYKQAVSSFEAAHDGVKVDVQLVSRDEKDLLLNCRVVDTGIGIAKDKQQAIFDSFTQADGSITRRYGGTGLGLAIASDLIRAMGGELSVRSELGAGSIVALQRDGADGRAVTDQRRHELGPEAERARDLRQPATPPARVTAIRRLDERGVIEPRN